MAQNEPSPNKTQKFSFIEAPDQRSGVSKDDQRFVNVYPEVIPTAMTGGKQYYLRKRPGQVSRATFPTSGEARGLYYWQGSIYSVIANVLYQNTTPIQALTTNTGPVGFVAYKAAAVECLVFCDGIKGFAISLSGGVAQPNQISTFPTPHLPYPLVIDGYVVVAGLSVQTIYNSNTGDPTTFDLANDFIEAEMYSDNVVRLLSSKNYIVAIGTASIEFLYDNANSTGSPFARNAPGVQQYGTCSPMACCTNEDYCIIPGDSGTGGKTVYFLQDFKSTDIATEQIREAMDAETNLTDARGSIFQIDGHTFYLLNLTTTNRSFVFNLDEKIWTEWSYNGENTRFNMDFIIGSPDTNDPTGQIVGTGELAVLDSTAMTDLGNPIYVLLQTDRQDMGTMKRKRLYQLVINCDAPNGTTPIPMTVSWSDDDYNTWSSGVTLNLNATYPTIRQLGYTKRRCWRFEYVQPYPLRMEYFEIDYTAEMRT